VPDVSIIREIFECVRRTCVITSMAGKRKILTLEQRVDCLKKFDDGVSCRAIALELGCGKTQIAAIRADKANVLRDWVGWLVG